MIRQFASNRDEEFLNLVSERYESIQSIKDEQQSRKENAYFTAEDLSEVNEERFEFDTRIDQLKIEIADLKEQYSCEVPIPEMAFKGINELRNHQELLELEDVIGMIEVYLWVSNHHPESFTQVN